MNIALVGCGLIAQVHATAIKERFNKEKDFSFILCDNKRENLNSFLEKFGGVGYDDFEQMLENEKIDCLHICTPHYLHVPMAIKALEKNINVIMEKPPAITIQQLQDLKKAESKSSATLGICFQNRYNDNSIALKEIIDSKKYGKILGGRAFVTWKRDIPYYSDSDWRGDWTHEGGGVLTNQTIHTLDLLNYFLGDPVSVQGNVANYHLQGTIEVEDSAMALINYGDYTANYFATTANVCDSPVFLEVVMQDMTLRIEGSNLYYIKDNKVVNINDYSTRENTQKSSTIKSYWGNSHKRLINDYYEKLAKGEKFPITINNCSNTIELVWGIYNSSRVGVEIKLK